MANGQVQLPYIAATSGKILDASELSVAAVTVERERMVIADDSAATGLAPVTSSGGLSVNITNPTTSVTITNPTTGVTITNTTTQTGIQGSTGTLWAISSAGAGYVSLMGSSGVAALVTSSGGLSITITNPTTGVTITNTTTQTGIQGSTGTLWAISSAGAGYVSMMGSSGVAAVVTSSGGLSITITNPTTAVNIANAVTLSSAGLTQVIPVTSSGVNLYSTLGLYMVAQPRVTPTPFVITVSCSGVSSTSKLLVAASGSSKIKVLSYVIVASSPAAVQFRSSGVAISGQMTLTSGAGIAVAGNMDAWVMETSAGGDLRISADNSSYVEGHGMYIYEV